MGCNLGMDLKRGSDPGREKQKETVAQHIHTVAKETSQHYIKINTILVYLTCEQDMSCSC